MPPGLVRGGERQAWASRQNLYCCWGRVPAEGAPGSLLPPGRLDEGTQAPFRTQVTLGSCEHLGVIMQVHFPKAKATSRP